MLEEVVDPVKAFRSLEYHLPVCLGEVPVGNIRIDTRFLRARKHLAHPPFIGRLGPGLDRAFFQAQELVRDDKVLIVPQDIAESVALLAGADRMIEGKKKGLRRIECPAAGRAGERLAET